jgi:hypothetical protein
MPPLTGWARKVSEGHAVIAPSSLHITVPCPGWIKNASLLPPQEETEETREGDAAHWVALQMVSGVTLVPVGSIAPNGVAITEEMVDGALMWVEALEGYPARLETRINIERIHPTQCWGTPDAWQWCPETKILRIADYKFGHKYVEVWNNYQLLAYAAGVMDFLGLSDLDVILELTIVQPRCYHKDGPVRTWTAAASKIRARINDAADSAAEALGPNPQTHSGPHCLHCPARATCTTFQETVNNILDFSGYADPLLKTPGETGRELRLINVAIERLKARQTGLEAQAEAMLREGKSVPFFKLDSSPGNLAWTAPLDEIEMLAQLGGKSVLKPPALVTPTQARDRKLLTHAIIEAYSKRPNGAMKITADNTSRLQRIFSK